MVWRSLLIGVVVTAAILAGFRFYGVRFFIDGRSPFQINFAAAAAVGLVLGLGHKLIKRVAAQFSA